MKKNSIKHLSFFVVLFLFVSLVQANPGSYLLDKNSCYTLWWSVGTYKANKTELPTVSKDITISAAQNEYEPFQLVLQPNKKMEDFRVHVSSLSGANGSIDSSHVKVYDVEYVYVSKPEPECAAGWYPDPMPPHESPRTLYPLENYPFFIDVYIPDGTPTGHYQGQVLLSWDKNREHAVVPFDLTVYDFSLPKTSSLRSSFGVDVRAIRQYHNLEDNEEVTQVYDMYLQEFRDNRICPSDPFLFAPMKVRISGIKWDGGVYDRSQKTEGTYSYKVDDTSLTKNVCATNQERVHLSPGTDYTLVWDAKCEGKQEYAVAVKLFNPEGKWLIYDNILETYHGESSWNRDTLKISNIPNEAVEAEITLYASFPSKNGYATGKTWFDNVIFSKKGEGKNLLSQGDFEAEIDKINVSIDFEDFDKAGERYLDEFGFNAFRYRFKGMGGGTFHSRYYGKMGGFEQKTPEYDKLMMRYLSLIEKHWEEKGWLGKEYVYWFDEPDEKDYPFVREGMNVLKNAAPGIKRFLTEKEPGTTVADVTDIYCSKWDHINPAVIDSLVRQGKEYWSYLCTSPKPPWVNLFIDGDATNLRMWCWMSYQYRLTGVLVWQSSYWNSNVLSEHGQLQNPWEDPMSYRRGYGTPLGKPKLWGNGDGRFFYPPNRDVNNDHRKYLEGPVRSIRLSILREGIEDYEYFVLLQKLRDKLNPRKDKTLIGQVDTLLHFDESFFSSGKDYVKDPILLYERRKAIASLIEKLRSAQKNSL